MNGPAGELVERLYRRLVQAVDEREDGAAGGLTVSDLYQHLIPYRAVRGELGVLELAQYEHALLRLLAGEGGFLRLVDEEARREVAAELRATNPILGIYRDYGTTGVKLTGPNMREDGERLQLVEEGLPEIRDVAELMVDEDDAAWEDSGAPLPEMPYPPPRPAAADATRVAPRKPPPAVPSPPAPPPADTTFQASPSPPEAGGGAAAPSRVQESCVSCSATLPDVDGLRYCPNCGADQVEVPCARCGTPIRGSWNFCIRCGSRRPTPAPSA